MTESLDLRNHDTAQLVRWAIAHGYSIRYHTHSKTCANWNKR